MRQKLFAEQFGTNNYMPGGTVKATINKINATSDIGGTGNPINNSGSNPGPSPPKLDPSSISASSPPKSKGVGPITIVVLGLSAIAIGCCIYFVMKNNEPEIPNPKT